MKNETTSDLDREIAKKLRRRWWKGPLLLSGALMIACVLLSIVADWSISPSGPSPSSAIAALVGLAGLLTFIIGFVSRLCSVHPIKEIKINEPGGCVTVTHYVQDGNKIVEKQWNVSLSTNTLFYEPKQEGTMIRNDAIIIHRPDDFAGWFRALREAEARKKLRLDINLPVHRVLPPEPTSQLALESAKCRVCGGAFEPDRPLIQCAKCRTPHHKDCWAYIGKCSTFNCGENNYTEAS